MFLLGIRQFSGNARYFTIGNQYDRIAYGAAANTGAAVISASDAGSRDLTPVDFYVSIVISGPLITQITFIVMAADRTADTRGSPGFHITAPDNDLRIGMVSAADTGTAISAVTACRPDRSVQYFDNPDFADRRLV